MVFKKIPVKFHQPYVCQSSYNYTTDVSVLCVVLCVDNTIWVASRSCRWSWTRTLPLQIGQRCLLLLC